MGKKRTDLKKIVLEAAIIMFAAFVVGGTANGDKIITHIKNPPSEKPQNCGIDLDFEGFVTSKGDSEE